MSRTIFDFDEFERLNSRTLLSGKYDYIIGTDEAGRGPAAGRVYASAVCFKAKNLSRLMPELTDSKKLSEKTRNKLYPVIKENSYFSIKFASVEVIEKINILNASLLCMKEATEDVIEKLDNKNVLVLVDGNRLIKNFNYPQKTIIKGDLLSASIAASSILAKVERDNYMYELDKKYPNYNFKKNKGYLTKEHICAIKQYGTTKEHRKSFLKNI